MIDKWSELKLDKYYELYKITSNQLMKEEDKIFHTAALLGGVTYNELMDMPLVEAEGMIKSASFLYQRPNPKKVKKEYILNGRTYTLLREPSEMSVAQYVDYNSVIAEKFEEHIPDLLSIMLVPKGKTYNNDYDHNQVIEDVKTMDVEEALGITDFFLKKYRRLLKRSLLYYEAAIKIAILKAPKEIRKELKSKEKELKAAIDALRTTFGYLSLNALLK